MPERLEAHGLVKSQSRFVEIPDVQLDLAKAFFLCPRFDEIKKLGADLPAAVCFVYGKFLDMADSPGYAVRGRRNIPIENDGIARRGAVLHSHDRLGSVQGR